MSQSGSVELDLDQIKQRSIKGVMALISRQYVLQGLALLANILFGIFLSPEEYGAYFVVAATVSFLAYFDDIGLGAALIQKKTKVTSKDLATTFTIQQGLTLVLVTGAFLATPIVTLYFNLNQIEIWLYYALLIAFFLATLKTIPTILLERDLEFNKVVIPTVLEQVAYYAVAVAMAALGFGLISFIWAVLVRGLVGLIAMYWIKPWRPSIWIYRDSAKELIKFGAPFQLNSLLSVVKDDLWIVFLGGIFSREIMGYISWAMKWTKIPLSLFVQTILNITFPVFSRLQHQPDQLGRAIDKAIFFVSLTVFPAVIGLMLVSPDFFRLFPGYAKWLPSIPLVYLFGFSTLLSAISTILTNTLNSIGQVKKTLMLMIIWIVIIWGVVVLTQAQFGYLAAGIAHLVTALSSIIAVPLVRKYIPISLWTNIYPALVGSMLMSVVVWGLTPYLSDNLLQLSLLIGLGGVVYCLSMWLMFKQRLLAYINSTGKYINLTKFTRILNK